MMPDYPVTVYSGFTSYERDDMKSVSGSQRFGAIAVAVSVTFSMVWSMASLGYPASAAAYPVSASAALSVCRGS